MGVSGIVGQPCRFVAFVMHESTQTPLLWQGFPDPMGASWLPRCQQAWGGRGVWPGTAAAQNRSKASVSPCLQWHWCHVFILEIRPSSPIPYISNSNKNNNWIQSIAFNILMSAGYFFLISWLGDVFKHQINTPDCSLNTRHSQPEMRAEM